MTINAQAGGVDAADWAQMLLRMYLRWAERKGYPTEVYETSYAEEAGHQVDDVRRQGPLRVRHAARRARHPPAGADQPVRQPGPPPDLVRRRGRGAGGRADRPHRHQRGRDPGRRLPLLRARRPGREHHRLGGADHPPAHRHRGLLPERAQPAAEPATAMAVLQAKLLERKRQEEAEQAGRAARRDAPPRGARRSATTCCTRTRSSRTCGRASRPATRPRCSTASIDEFIEAEIRWLRRQETGARPSTASVAGGHAGRAGRSSSPTAAARQRRQRQDAARQISSGRQPRTCRWWCIFARPPGRRGSGLRRRVRRTVHRSGVRSSCGSSPRLRAARGSGRRDPVPAPAGGEPELSCFRYGPSMPVFPLD